MKEIKYYDKINKRVVILTVKNDIADFIKKNKKETNRQNKKIKSNEISLDLLMQKWNNTGFCDINSFLDEKDYEIEELNMSLLEYQKERLAEIFLKLPERNRTILELKYKKNFSNVKIAETLVISESYVRKLIQNSLEMLKNLI